MFDATADDQAHGKQDVSATMRASGLWATVWSECVPAARVEDLLVVATLDGAARVALELAGADGRSLASRVAVTLPDGQNSHGRRGGRRVQPDAARARARVVARGSVRRSPPP